MDISLIIKLRNYFSDRIEEIKDGRYVPTYEQIKEMPEFRGVSQEAFRMARKNWYWQHFRMSSVKFTKRLENIKAGYVSENKFAERLKNIKAEYISEEESDKESKRVTRKTGFCFLCLGVLIFANGLLGGYSLNWDPNRVGGYFFLMIIVMVFGIILLVIGLILVKLYYTKMSKIKSPIISDRQE